jgi:ribosomal protein S2
MGLVKEPKGVDFIIKSTPMNKDEEKALSLFIKKRKEEIKKKKTKQLVTT